jgi:AcrR family transcriptional regulator/DNA-binding MarR family transcriptional regulator
LRVAWCGRPGVRPICAFGVWGGVLKMVRAKRAPRSGVRASGSRSSRANGSSALGAGEGLAPGPNGLERAQVLEIQRARILGAMTEVVLERGVPGVNVEHVVSRAGVSRRTFYEIFPDREECFLAALQDGLARIAAVVVLAYEGADPAHSARGARQVRAWQERIRAALTALLYLLDEDPGLGRLVVVESLAAGPRALERRNRVLARLIAAVDEGRAGSGPAPLTAEGVVGAVSSILYARLAAGVAPVTGDARTGKEQREPAPTAGGSLVELTGPLMGMIMLPYLGRAAAARELARPVPPVRASVQRSGVGYPFHELGMRLTYRTLRVLDAVACNPDASNRLIGELAGIADQGQISKLLARLARLGLIDNAPGASAKGLSNKWRLTEKGQGIQRAIEEPRGATHDDTTSKRGTDS